MPTATTVWDLDALVPGQVFAATSDGVFRSSNGGATWVPRSDGLTGTVTRVFKDPARPTVLYAATSSGVFRSTTSGARWSAVDGTGAHRLGNEMVRALEPIVNGTDTRLYAGTADGMWVGVTGGGVDPGPVRWQRATTAGLATPGQTNRVFWALQLHGLPVGTMLAGTQSNGGYALTFVPPIPLTPPVTTPSPPRVGMEQTATNGTSGGTPPIEFAHRWQRCSTTDTDSCVDIEDAEDPAYVPVAADQGQRLRVVVTAENAFPTLGLIRQWSAITAPVGANPSPNFLPGAAQIAAPQIAVDAPGSATLPQSGDVLRAVGGLFQPAATSRSYVWLRCAAAGDDCAPLPGETYPTLALDDEDVGRRFRVIVTGHNVHGAKAAPESGPTNTVFPADPAPTSPPVVLGDAVVGETLVGSVGSWPFPGTTWTRRWLRCAADGGGCATIAGQTGPTYVPGPDDLGRRLRVAVTADPNAAGVYPPPATVDSAASAPVVAAPVPPAPPVPPGPGPSGPTDPPPPTAPVVVPPLPEPPRQGPPRPTPDRVRPVLSAPVLSARRVVRGRSVVLAVRSSEAARATIRLERLTVGRRSGTRCSTVRRRGSRCTAVRTVRTTAVAVRAGRTTVRIATRAGRRAVPAGRYRVAVRLTDAAGNRSAERRVSLRVRSR